MAEADSSQHDNSDKEELEKNVTASPSLPVLKYLLRVCIQNACPTQLRLHHLLFRWLLSLSYKISNAIPW